VNSDDEEADFEKETCPVSEPMLHVPFQGITSYNMINQIGIFRTWSLKGSLVPMCHMKVDVCTCHSNVYSNVATFLLSFMLSVFFT